MKTLSNEERDRLTRRIQQTDGCDEYAAMDAIGEAVASADPALLPAIIAATRSGDEWVVSKAVRSLGEQAALLHGAGRDQRPAVVAALLERLQRNAPGLADLPFTLDDDPAPMAAYAAASLLSEMDAIRLEAATSLGQIGDAAAIPILLQRLEATGESRPTKKAIAAALRALVDTEATASGPSDEDLRRAARAALARWHEAE
jgi:HEAT repeat protein